MLWGYGALVLLTSVTRHGRIAFWTATALSSMSHTPLPLYILANLVLYYFYNFCQLEVFTLFPFFLLIGAYLHILFTYTDSFSVNHPFISFAHFCIKYWCFLEGVPFIIYIWSLIDCRNSIFSNESFICQLFWRILGWTEIFNFGRLKTITFAFGL